MNYSVFPLSEDAIIIQFENNHKVKQDVQIATQLIQSSPIIEIIEIVPAYHTITIYYNPFLIHHANPYEIFKKRLETILNGTNLQTSYKKRYFEIPVCYEIEYGPDLNNIASSNQLSVEEVITLHTNPVYEVAFIGFSPGFPFLTGLNERIFHPRKTSPRLKVVQGSVGIAGNQTGIYPITSPGGWQIIGRTPINLFRLDQSPPTLLKAGDQIKFFSISNREFFQWEETLWE